MVKTGITTKDKKEYQKMYKRRYHRRRRENTRYLKCNICSGKYTNEHVGWHKKGKKHIRMQKYIDENPDFKHPEFIPVPMDIFSWE